MNFKRKTIDQLAKQGLDERTGKIIIAVHRKYINDYTIYKDNNFAKKLFGEDVNITKDEATHNHVVTQEITINDIIEHINYLNEELKTRKETNKNYWYNNQIWPEEYPIATVSKPKENPPETQKLLVSEERADSNIFNMLDLND